MPGRRHRRREMGIYPWTRPKRNSEPRKANEVGTVDLRRQADNSSTSGGPASTGFEPTNGQTVRESSRSPREARIHRTPAASHRSENRRDERTVGRHGVGRTRPARPTQDDLTCRRSSTTLEGGSTERSSMDGRTARSRPDLAAAQNRPSVRGRRATRSFSASTPRRTSRKAREPRHRQATQNTI